MRIWADMDNAPHVLVLNPLINELKNRGHDVYITAREYGQTLSLLELYDLKYKAIGKHSGRRKFKKVISTLTRSMALYFYAKNKQFDLAFCHGSRSIYFTSKILNIPLVVLGDYEHGYLPAFIGNWAQRVITPDIIPCEIIKEKGIDISKIAQYSGLKEEFYIYDFKPDPNVLDKIGVDREKIIVLLRPPATMSHYHSI